MSTESKASVIANSIYQEGQKVLTIRLTGKISSANAADFAQELNDLRERYPSDSIVLDMDELQYISSAGLRVLLNLAKSKKEKLRAVNASPDIAEIFRVTGFGTFIDVAVKMRQVDVEGCEVIGQGANGVVYRLDPDTIIKVFQPGEDLSVIERERNRAQLALLEGIPTAISYDVVKVGECFGIVFEMINSKSLAAVIREDDENFARYAKEYTALFKKIHATKGSAETFGPIKAVYDEAIEYCRDWYEPEQLNKLRALIHSIPDRDTLIHGDYHPKNIMLIDGELTLIDMGDVSLGHPIFDFLATAATQVNLVKLNPAFAEHHTGMPVARITQLWNALLDGYFEGKSREEIDRIDKQIAAFSKIKVALAPYFGKGAGEAVIRASVDDAKANLLPMIDSMIGSVDW